MEKDFIKMSSRFGHEVAIAHLAERLGKKVVIIPETENEIEFYIESKKIKEMMSFFNQDLIEIDFSEREIYKEKSWDFVQSLRDGTLDNEFIWDAFFSKKCGPKKVWFLFLNLMSYGKKILTTFLLFHRNLFQMVNVVQVPNNNLYP